jgi:hypothetical protein
MGINRINIKPATSKIPHPILDIVSDDATPTVNVTGPRNGRKKKDRYVNVYWTEASDPPEFAKFFAKVQEVVDADQKVTYQVIRNSEQKGWAEAMVDGEHGPVERWHKSEVPGEEGWVGQLTVPHFPRSHGNRKKIFALALWHNHDWDTKGAAKFFEEHPPTPESHQNQSPEGHHTVVIIEDDGGGA